MEDPDESTNISDSNKCGRFREEYRKHVQTQISRDLTETLNLLNNHKGELTKLQDQLQQARLQVVHSVAETEEKINSTFETLLINVNRMITERHHQLLDEVKQVEVEALGPLDECGRLLSDRLKGCSDRLQQGARLQKGTGTKAKESIIRFQEETAQLNSLPDVPELCAVPCVSVEFPSEPTLEESIQSLIQGSGKVSRIGPVQITNINERPGALLVSWEEVDEDVGDDSVEFCLQCSNTGALNPDTANFHTVYKGPDFSFLLRNLQSRERYLLRAAMRREGSSSWSTWSLPQYAQTSIPHYKWAAVDGWSIADDGRLATKASTDSDILLSQGPLLGPGLSVLFKVLGSGDACSDEGIGLSCRPIQGTEQLLHPGVLFLNAQGCVFLDGMSRVTRLPAITAGSELSFSMEQVNLSKLRVIIESQDKQVTYDWSVPDGQRNLYFAANFVDPQWKISVH